MPRYQFTGTAREWMDMYFGDLLSHSTQEKAVLYGATAEPSFQALWRTLVMDCKCYSIERLKSGDIIADDEVFRNLLGRSIDDINRAYDMNSAEKREEFRELEDSLVSRNMWDRSYPHWTFAVSENGLYCMLKRGTRPGDTLAILDGGKVPVVLRELDGDGSRFAFVNTAYVHGFMDGQAVQAVDVGALARQDIMLV